MKSFEASLNTHLQGVTTSMTTCWKIKRTDGVIVTATALDIDIPFNLVDDGEGDGELIYLSDSGFNRSALEGTADFKVGNMEIQGIIDDIVTKEDIRAERYDFAKIWIFQVNWKDLSQKEVKLQTGYLGRISLYDNLFVAEIRDLLELFLYDIGEIVVEECPVDLFDAKCKVREIPPDWLATTVYTEINTADAALGSYVSSTVAGDRNKIFRCTNGGTSHSSEPSWNLTVEGTTTETGGVEWTTMYANKVIATVATVASRQEFTVTMNPAADMPDIHLREGTIKFIDGENANLFLRNEIKDWDLSSGTISMWRPLPFDIEVGQTLYLSAGCDKSTGRCSGGFFNIFNYRGWPHVPGTNKILERPIVPE